MCQIIEIIKNFNSISIPEYLLYESTIKNRNLIWRWIRYRINEQQSGMPEELKYSGWQTDKDWFGRTPLMQWIEFRYDDLIRGGPLEPYSCIPEELKYPRWQTDKDYFGRTPLIRWAQRSQYEPTPEELKYFGL